MSLSPVLNIRRLAVQIVTTRPGRRVAPVPSGTGSSGDCNIMTRGDAILSAQEVKEDLQGRTSEPRATHKARLFAGSDRGGQRAALLYSLIVSAKLNDAKAAMSESGTIATMLQQVPCITWYLFI